MDLVKEADPKPRPGASAFASRRVPLGRRGSWVVAGPAEASVRLRDRARRVPVGRRRNRRRKRLNDVTRWDLARAVVEIAAISTVVLVLVGNIVGLIPGLIATIFNIQIFRTDMNRWLQYLITLAVSVLAVAVYRAIALYIPRLAAL